MTNEQNVVRAVFSSYINDIKAYSTNPNRPTIKMLEDVRDKAIEALEEVEKHKETFDWCTGCKEYDSEAHCCHRWSKCINETVNEIKSTSNTRKWIPVTERLPETRDEVLISLADGRITIASYNDHFLPFFNKPIGWGVDAKRFVFDFCSDDVIAWMLLPEPYKEEGE